MAEKREIEEEEVEEVEEEEEEEEEEEGKRGDSKKFVDSNQALTREGEGEGAAKKEASVKNEEKGERTVR